jgi:type IV secretion system protein VirB5
MSDLHKEQPSFNYGAAVTPFQKAAQEWDERIGSARVQAKNWRLACLIIALLCLILATALVFSIRESKNTVFVAEVASEGQIVNVSPLQEQYTPNTAQESYFIGHFLKLIMSLPLDPVVLRRNLLDAYQFVTGRAQQQLNELMKTDQPLAKVGKQTQVVEVQRVQKITPNSYEARWQQTIYNQNGQVQQVKYYSSVFTITHRAPRTPDQIKTNPLGIYIAYMTLTERDSK